MKSYLIYPLLLWVTVNAGFSQLIVDHTCTDITEVPQAAIEAAKQQLHIAYGHTSHGSQVVDGMNGLVNFANNGGKGLSLPTDIFTWNNGGTDGSLDLHDYAMGGDVGYFPAWYNNTLAYLEDAENSDVNVIMWSWCGQVGGKYTNGTLWDEFLKPMSDLEIEYPDITFVYMTGHLDYWDREATNAANDSIRSFCRNNNKVLFDFADIESYAPDGTCYKENGNDNCDYRDQDDQVIGNWAQEYQNSHTEGIDWYQCGSQHSEPLNANLKAYAAWWMFSSLAGWNYTPTEVTEFNEHGKTIVTASVYPNPAVDYVELLLNINLGGPQHVDLINSSGQIIEPGIKPMVSTEGTLFHINTSDLPVGIYFLRHFTEAGTDTYKIILTD